MQSFMFATWCPPCDRAMVSRLVSRQDRVESSFDGGVFRMDWWVTRPVSPVAYAAFLVGEHVGYCMGVVELGAYGSGLRNPASLFHTSVDGSPVWHAPATAFCSCGLRDLLANRRHCCSFVVLNFTFRPFHAQIASVAHDRVKVVNVRVLVFQRALQYPRLTCFGASRGLDLGA